MPAQLQPAAPAPTRRPRREVGRNPCTAALAAVPVRFCHRSAFPGGTLACTDASAPIPASTGFCGFVALRARRYHPTGVRIPCGKATLQCWWWATKITRHTPGEGLSVRPARSIGARRLLWTCIDESDRVARCRLRPRRWRWRGFGCDRRDRRGALRSPARWMERSGLLLSVRDIASGRYVHVSDGMAALLGGQRPN